MLGAEDSGVTESTPEPCPDRAPGKMVGSNPMITWMTVLCQTLLLEEGTRTPQGRNNPLTALRIIPRASLLTWILHQEGSLSTAKQFRVYYIKRGFFSEVALGSKIGVWNTMFLA